MNIFELLTFNIVGLFITIFQLIGYFIVYLMIPYGFAYILVKIIRDVRAK